MLKRQHLGGKSSSLPPPEDVLAQLDRILHCRNLRDAPTLQNFLRFVVEEALSGRGDELDVSKIARSVFGKGADFSNAENSVVRVAAHRLRAALSLHYATDGKADQIIIGMEPGNYSPSVSFREQGEDMASTEDVVRLLTTYNRVATPKTHATAYQAAARAIEVHPDDPELLATFAELSLDAYANGFEDDSEHRDNAARAMERATELEPDNPRVHFVNGLLALQRGDIRVVEECGRAILAVCGEDDIIAAQGAWLIALVSDLEDDTRPGMVELPDWGEHPGWLHHPNFLAFYHRGDYESALSAAIAFGMPDFFWGPLERAAALAQLGMMKAARSELERAVRLNPQLPEEPRRFLSSYILNKETLELVLEGLEKAGLSEMKRQHSD